MHGFVHIFALVIIKHPDVEVGLEILWVHLEGSLVKLNALIKEVDLCIFDTVGDGVHGIDVLRVDIQDFLVNCSLKGTYLENYK